MYRVIPDNTSIENISDNIERINFEIEEILIFPNREMRLIAFKELLSKIENIFLKHYIERQDREFKEYTVWRNKMSIENPSVLLEMSNIVYANMPKDLYELVLFRLRIDSTNHTIELLKSKINKLNKHIDDIENFDKIKNRNDKTKDNNETPKGNLTFKTSLSPGQLENFSEQLIKHGYIAEETDIKDFRAVFEGQAIESIKNPIKWIDIAKNNKKSNTVTLIEMFYLLNDNKILDENDMSTNNKEANNFYNKISKCFVDTNGNSIISENPKGRNRKAMQRNPTGTAKNPTGTLKYPNGTPRNEKLAEIIKNIIR